MHSLLICSLLLLAFPASSKAEVSSEQDSGASYAQGRKLFYEKKYDEALDSFIASYHKEGNRRSLMKFIEECLRETDEPWLLNAGANPKWENLIPLIEARRNALKSFDEIQGDLIDRRGKVIVKFTKSSYEALDDKAQKIVKNVLATFPQPALRLTSCGPFSDAPEMNALLMKSARFSQALIKDKAVPQKNIFINYKKAQAFSCEMTLTSARAKELLEPREPVESILAAEQIENGNADTFELTVFLTDPSQAETWFVSILDTQGRSVARIAGDGEGFVRSVLWTPAPSLNGAFKPVAHMKHSAGSSEVEGNPILIKKEQPQTQQYVSVPAPVQVQEPVPAPAVHKNPKPQPVQEEVQTESLHRQKILFENGTATLKGQSWKYVRIWGRDIAPANPSSKIVILGSSTAEEASKFPKLAEQRAHQIQSILESQFGIASSRFRARKMGSRENGSGEPAAYIFLEESYETVP